MTDLGARLLDLLAPIRAQGVAALLEAAAEAIARGAEVEPEPLVRGPDGAVLRAGPLDLPERADLAARREGRELRQRVEPAEPPAFEPVSLVLEGGFTTVVEPFPWHGAGMVLEARQSRPDWRPLRRWFLEWVQPRHGDVAPELLGAVHRLEGPARRPARGADWALTVDFGSAPVQAVPALIEALARSGALRLRIGGPG